MLLYVDVLFYYINYIQRYITTIYAVYNDTNFIYIFYLL